ncbi:MAG: M20/M25/M40 family metallo-hydrolase [Oscillospiraceae bacterium]|nr:M20/M25/M40 family metallo-hydrolase [Oscillospiraceae bacterium]
MVGIIILGLLLAFLAVLVIRALLFTPKAQPAKDETPAEFDKDAAVSALQKLVQCKTISYNDHSLEDEAEFRKLIDMLPQLYPAVFKTCHVQELPDWGLLLRWDGKAHDAPSVMMAHFDVVPVVEEMWEKPPFAGILEDGVLWGRGTLDTKVTMNGALSAANALIGQGFQPEQDIYFAFSGGEEVNGLGAVNIVKYFQENGIVPALVVDEGGGVVENVFPGVKEPCAMIGIAEKGLMNVRYTVHSGGGHASAPLPKSPVTDLAKACRKVVDNPFQMHLTKPVAEMFDTLGRHSSFLYKLIFSNLWCFKPVLNLICVSSGGEMNALVRTTTAFTQMEGSTARNVIPAKASMVSNMRLNPEDSVASATEYLKKTVADDSVEIEVLESFEPSRISQTDCEAYRKVASAVANTWRGCITTPYLMVQCSDSRHYGAISDKVYRFSAMDLTKEERGTIHGNNERIRVEALHRAVEFYVRLLRQC